MCDSVFGQVIFVIVATEHDGARHAFSVLDGYSFGCSDSFLN